MSVIVPNEGKDWWNNHALAGSTVYAGILRGGKTVAGGTIIATSTLAGLASEENGTGYARKSTTLGATSNGIMVFTPPTSWNTLTATDWHADDAAWFIASASSGGVAIVVWDMSGRTGTTTNASAVVTALSATSDLRVGSKVYGTGVAAGATILTIDSATQVTLSANCTASASGVNLAFARDMSGQNALLTLATLNVFGKNVGE